MRSQRTKSIVLLPVAATVALFLAFVLQGPLPETQPEAAQTAEIAHQAQTGRGNRAIENFEQAKPLAWSVHSNHLETFYCGCRILGRKIDTQSCGFRPQHEDERSHRIEWEHIVPASAFGQSFIAWRDGDPMCVTEAGKPYKGRRCARKAAPEFRLMEGDLYNLAPSIGEVNQARGAKPFGEVIFATYNFGGCKSKFSADTVEPRAEIRGIIARTYLYMDWAYPGRGIISRKNRKLFAAWNRQYPPDDAERTRAATILRLQKNENPFMKSEIASD